ncbi:hypothetical protein [Streptomyces sp. NPDC017949]|uniref:hypothetical protein n=1 Tax=Streptomyces sp. NPDC017949 TaxID=3365020 RepID=UPI00379CE92A
MERAVQPRNRGRRLPRLRWAARHPLEFLRRSGFGAGLSLAVLLFVGGWVLWLLYAYATHLS